jgi:hypothetical protein
MMTASLYSMHAMLTLSVKLGGGLYNPNPSGSSISEGKETENGKLCEPFSLDEDDPDEVPSPISGVQTSWTIFMNTHSSLFAPTKRQSSPPCMVVLPWTSNLEFNTFIDLFGDLLTEILMPLICSDFSKLRWTDPTMVSPSIQTGRILELGARLWTCNESRSLPRSLPCPNTCCVCTVEWRL